MPRKREYAVAEVFGTSVHAYRPTNEYDALMQTAPHEAVPVSVEEAQPLIGQIQAALDQLPPHERHAFEGFYLGGERLEDIGREWGVSRTTAWRMKERARVNLAEILGVETLARHRLSAVNGHSYGE